MLQYFIKFNSQKRKVKLLNNNSSRLIWIIRRLWSNKKDIEKFNLLDLKDAAQRFAGEYKNWKSCSFRDIAKTSFFRTKPIGFNWDFGTTIFTNHNELANLLKSLRLHG